MENNPEPEKTKTKPVKITLAEELLERVQSYCDERDMTIQEFVSDAIIEKLNLVYKERRKKGRM